MNNGLVKIVTGIRRCGKSFLLFNLFDEFLRNNNILDTHIVKIALDDCSNKKLRDPDELLKYLKEKIVDKEIYYILLDEIQLVDEFEDVLNSLLHINNVDIYVTGSNSKFLSSDIMIEFRGRDDEIHVMPLSLSYKTDDKKEEYLKNLFKMTYISDIVERHKIKDVTKIDDLIRVLASSIGSLINSNKIANAYQSLVDKTISVNTIDDYLAYLEEAYIIKKAERYDIKGRKKYCGNKEILYPICIQII